jgi:hypothetical protein
MTTTRRYAIEISDLETDQIVALTAAEWTDAEREFAVAQILQLAGFMRPAELDDSKG